MTEVSNLREFPSGFLRMFMARKMEEVRDWMRKCRWMMSQRQQKG